MTENAILTPEEARYKVDLQLPTITIQHFQELKEQLSGNIQKYQNMLVTPENVKDSKKVKASMNNLKRELNDQRKAVKAEYNKPLDAFEKQAKELTGMIDQVIQPIDKSIKIIEEQEREERRKAVQREIEEIAPNYGIDPAEVVQQDNWSNASISKVQRLREIGQTLIDLQAKHERQKADKAATEAYAEAAGLDPSGWLQLLAQGQPFIHIRTLIDDEKRRRDEAATRERLRKESEAAIAAAKQQQVNGRTVDVETGEVVEPDEPHVVTSADLTQPIQAPEQRYTRSFRVTASKDQMWRLANFMESEGIEYESIKERESYARAE